MKRIVSKLAVLAAMALLCSGTMFLSTVVRAQCPTDCAPCPPPPHDDAQYDTTPIPWNSGDTCAEVAMDAYGDSCWVNICYIWRQTSLTNYDYAVTQVCSDCPYDDSTIIDMSSWWLMQNNPQHFPTDTCPCEDSCPTCGGNHIQWNEDFITCWTYCFTPQGGKIATMCPDHGWCIDAYYVCWDLARNMRLLCYDRSVQTTWQCNIMPQGICESPCTNPWGGCPSFMGPPR